MDQREQRGLVIAATIKITQRNGLWEVPSESRPRKKYLVNPVRSTCTCPDHLEGHKCKHIFAAEYTIRREANANGAATDSKSLVLTEQKKIYAPRNWSAINLAHTSEKERFQVLLHHITRDLVNEPARTGRPRVALSDVMFAVTYNVYTTVSTRRFMSDLKEVVAKGYVSRQLHYNSVNANMESAHLTPVFHELIERSSLPLKEVETDFAADSTGFSTSRFVRWYDHKYGANRPGHDWIKVHVMTGVKTNIITAVEIRGRSAHDAPLFGSLVRKTAKNFRILEVAADKGYLSQKNLQVVADIGGTPYIPFRENSLTIKGGLWEKLLNFYKLHHDEFLEHYHKRSQVEATFAMIKSKFRDHVRGRTDVSMRNEVLAKILCHNICCLIQSQCELGIEPVFWPRDSVIS